MTTLRIYADFNGLVGGPKNPNRTAVVLDTWGSLVDLSNAGVVLSEGLPLIAFDESDETEDLEGTGTAEYDWTQGWWVVEFDASGIRYVPRVVPTPPRRSFRCARCRAELARPEHIQGTLQRRDVPDACPHCGTSILAPYAAPEARRMQPPLSVEAFAELARRFCALLDGRVTRDDLHLALAELHLAALRLPETGGGTTSIAFKPTRRSMPTLPLDAYWAPLGVEPHEAPELGLRSLADDLGDIRMDLERGLARFDAGDRDEACWEWRFSFQAHWAAHLVSAAWALRMTE